MKNELEAQLGARCIALWGEQDQIRQTIEECAELIVKLAKYKRKVNGSSKDQICEEIADVEIMCNQMRIIFGSEFVDIFKTKKLNRLNIRVGIEEQELKNNHG